MQGWIKIHRSILEWQWYNNPNVLRVWLHLLLSANHEPKKWQGVVIERGQLVTGRKILSRILGLSEQQIRSAISLLKTNQQITIKSTNKYTIITICNYDTYQDLDETNNQQKRENITNQQPTNNQQITTNKNERIKEDNKKEKDIDKSISKKKNEIKNSENSNNLKIKSDKVATSPPNCGAPPAPKKATPTLQKAQYAEFVSMSNDEYQKLVAQIGEAGAKRCIEILDNYKGASGRKYKSDYRAIQSWVISRFNDEKHKANGKQSISYDDSKERRRRESAEFRKALLGEPYDAPRREVIDTTCEEVD